jgi:AcrR family transcriptional regulator
MERRTGAEARQRILDAAIAEYTQYGMDGARIDRIARTAGASKERLYAYFGDKQSLFEEAIRDATERSSMAVGMEGEDLVGYAGRMAAHFFDHPGDLRLLSWIRLQEEGERVLKVDAVAAEHERKLAAIRRAQAKGTIDPAWDPDELTQIVIAVATYWARASGTGGLSRQHCVTVVEDAVRRLVAPRPAPEAGQTSR